MSLLEQTASDALDASVEDIEDRNRMTGIPNAEGSDPGGVLYGVWEVGGVRFGGCCALVPKQRPKSTMRQGRAEGTRVATTIVKAHGPGVRSP